MEVTTIDPLASSSADHSDMQKRDVVRAFAHIDNFWRHFDLKLYLVLFFFFGGNLGVLLFWICSSREGESSMVRKWSAIGFTLLATAIFYGSKPRIFRALAFFQVVRSWNFDFLEMSGTPMTTVGGGASQIPDRDEGSLSVYGMGKFSFHIREFVSKLPYVLLNLQRVVSGTVALISQYVLLVLFKNMPDDFKF
ncbi:hypothetical protein B9479_002401 [Cryptococcus floricola]|uniref:Uncharacterized protein n=1 Tax=Cryptococcus floricola TaxID=2591691 RepID=A0A5D3B039_9TREE|nr:hypothetical protein B9479_002401 [Cryptococcus floricola]